MLRYPYNIATILFILVMYVFNTRGTHLAIVDGFSFYYARQSKNTMYWQCTSNNNGGKKCKARLTTLAEGDRALLRANIEHNHNPPIYEIVNGIYYKL